MIIVALLDVFFHSVRQAYLETVDTKSPQQSNSLPVKWVHVPNTLRKVALNKIPLGLRRHNLFYSFLF